MYSTCSYLAIHTITFAKLVKASNNYKIVMYKSVNHAKHAECKHMYYTYVPGIGRIKSVLAVWSKTELINTSHWYSFWIITSLMLSDGMMNMSLYIDESLMLLLAVTLLTLLTCVLPVVHMMSTVPIIPLTIVASHCNINDWLIAGLLAAVTSTVMIGSASKPMQQSKYGTTLMQYYTRMLNINL